MDAPGCVWKTSTGTGLAGGHGSNALAWSGLLSNHLQTGNLVRPTQTILRADVQFCLLEPQGRAPNRQSVNRFRQWLMAHLAKTIYT